MRSLTPFLALALTIPLRAQEPVTLLAGRMLDGRGGQQKNVTIVVDGERILRVEPGRPDRRPTYDLVPYTVMPGLIDAHSHVIWYINRKRRGGETKEPGERSLGSLGAAKLPRGGLASR